MVAVLDAMPNSNIRPEDETREEADLVYRQTFMFSATMPAAVEKISLKYFRRPVHVQIGEVGTPIDKIEQRVQWVGSENQKKVLMMQLLGQSDPPIVIFCNQREKVEKVAQLLESEGYTVCLLLLRSHPQF